jgi:protein-S-isoprenylcysteine O-methyltransferase Ste14
MRALVTRNLVTVGVTGLLLFGSAGTLAWPPAWVFLALFFCSGHAVGHWLLKTNPDFLAERLKSPLRGNRTHGDGVVTALIYATFCVWVVVMALDAKRFEWSSVPPWARAGGGVLILGTFLAWGWVLRENVFAVTSVRLQPEREQIVITTGPYAIVRHPMYAAAAGFFLGTPLLLGSLWGVLGIAVFMPLLGLRALSEEKMLMDGLAGYRAYAAAVRFRLAPGLW